MVMKIKTYKTQIISLLKQKRFGLLGLGILAFILWLILRKMVYQNWIPLFLLLFTAIPMYFKFNLKLALLSFLFSLILIPLAPEISAAISDSWIYPAILLELLVSALLSYFSVLVVLFSRAIVNKYKGTNPLLFIVRLVLLCFLIFLFLQNLPFIVGGIYFFMDRFHLSG